MRNAHSVFHMPTDTATAAWGRRYREARLARGWTQKEVAARSGLDQALISRVERGSGLSMRNHILLATTLGVSLDALTQEVA